MDKEIKGPNQFARALMTVEKRAKEGGLSDIEIRDGFLQAAENIFTPEVAEEIARRIAQQATSKTLDKALG